MTTSTFQLGFGLGLLVPYCVGPFVSFMWLALVSLLISLGYVVFFAFFPESPYDLASMGRREEAIGAVRFLRGIRKEDAAMAVAEVDAITVILVLEILVISRGPGKGGKFIENAEIFVGKMIQSRFCNGFRKSFFLKILEKSIKNRGRKVFRRGKIVEILGC